MLLKYVMIMIDRYPLVGFGKVSRDKVFELKHLSRDNKLVTTRLLAQFEQILAP